MYSKVGIVVLNWNGMGVIEECLHSLTEVNYDNFIIFLVDNGSRDSSIEYVKSNHPDVVIIQNNKNLGVAYAQNQGIEASKKNGCEFVFITNNDVIFDPEILNELKKGLERIGIGVVGPVILSFDEPMKIQSAGGMIDWVNGSGNHLRVNEAVAPLNEDIYSEYIGIIFAYTDYLLKIGGFNSKYFAYWEDVEICTKIRISGGKVMSTPYAKIWHRGSYTTGKISGFKEYYVNRNMFLFAKEHGTGQQITVLVLSYFLIGFWRKLGRILRTQNCSVSKWLILGMIDGLLSNDSRFHT